MDTGLLKGFAAGARVDLIKEVGARLDLVLAAGSVARAETPASVAALERAVGRDGREAVVDQVAYTWFNRIIALRFMDANGYTGVGVVSPEPGKTTGQPQVLSDAKGGDFDADVVSAKTQATITALLNGTRPSSDPQGEAYGLLLEAYCRFWNQAMPFMFEREGDYTELLMPAALLAADSVRDRAVRTLTDEACGEVEVIGWLYQFYISERKDEVFAGFKKNKKAGAAEIPAATQLFTPHWIVRYLVENSLGRLWLLNHPDSQLAEQMDYYIPPVDEETDFLKVSSPEELKIIDPAAGSGHMLTYAFDLLYAIYEEQAYSPSEIPSKILEHNLYGAEIDPRAGALAAFALTMKAAKKRKLFLKNPVQPHICVLENVRFEQADLDYLWSLTSGSVVRSDADTFWNAFEHADTFGSLIQPNEALIPVLRPVVEQLENTGNLLATPARRVLEQAEQLSTRYHVVVANPPYMIGAKMGDLLAEYAKSRYPTTKSDLYAMFIDRCIGLAVRDGIVGMVTMQSWMFIVSFDKLREEFLASMSLRTLAHFGESAFDSIGGDVVATAAFAAQRREATRTRGAFLRLVAGRNESEKSADLRAIAAGRNEALRFDVSQLALTEIPDQIMAYWLGEDLLNVVHSAQHVDSLADVRQGLSPADKPRFMRTWWEVDLARTTMRDGAVPKWFPYNKGGGFRRWYGNVEHVINWLDDGAEIRAYPKAAVRNAGYYLRESLTWSKVSSGRPSFRYVPPDYMFDGAAGALFPRRPEQSFWLLALLNSGVIEAVLQAYAPTLNFTEGNIASLPIPKDLDSLAVDAEVQRLIEMARADWDLDETSWGFQGMLEDSTGSASVASAYQSAVAVAANRASAMRATEVELDSKISASFGLQQEPVDPSIGREDMALRRNPFASASRSGATAGDYARQLLSYGVGCMFGRYSLDVPGLILANQGDSLQEYLAKVSSPSFTPDADGVIPVVDGEWFEDDIVAKFRQFLRVAFGEEHFEENLKFVIDSLGVKDLRDYFVKSFYKDHVQRYKKRPIYWMFSSPKGSFNALVYLHRYNPSTVSTVLNEYLREFIKKLEASLEQQEHIVVSGAGAREVAAAQKEAERLRKVLIELADYERDLYDLASKQIDLDLDDGVLVNYQKFGAALKDIGLKKGNENA